MIPSIYTLDEAETLYKNYSGDCMCYSGHYRRECKTLFECISFYKDTETTEEKQRRDARL